MKISQRLILNDSDHGGIDVLRTCCGFKLLAKDTCGYRVEEIYDSDQRDFAIFWKHYEGSFARIAKKKMLRDFFNDTSQRCG